MKQRIITALILAVILVPLLVLGEEFFLLVGIFATYVAGFELLNMFSTSTPALKKYRFTFPLFNVLLMVTHYFVFDGQLELSFFLFMIIAMFVATQVICLSDKRLGMSAFGLFSTVLIYGGLFFACTCAIRNVSTVGLVTDAKYLGLWLMVYLFASTMITDIAAYFVGIKFGRHKLAPVISPKKSIEGAVGGSIVGTLCGTGVMIAIEQYYNVAFFGHDNMVVNILLIVLLTLAVTVIGQVGDLVASKFKREYGIKDYSNIFPGHGGILDRFDSILATGTFMYIVFLFIGIF